MANIKKTLTILNSLFNVILNDNENKHHDKHKILMNHTHDKEKDAFPEENSIDWSKIYSQKSNKHTDKFNDRTKINGIHKVTQSNDGPYEIVLMTNPELIQENHEDSPLYNGIDTFTEEEIRSDLNDVQGDFRQKRSIEFSENEIDIGDQLVKTNELKLSSLPKFQAPTKNKIKFKRVPIVDSLLNSKIKLKDDFETLKESRFTGNENKTVKKEEEKSNKVTYHKPRSELKTPKASDSPNQKTTENIIKMIPSYTQKPEPLTEKGNQNPVYRITYHEPTPAIGMPRFPKVKTYKFVGNNVVKKLDSIDVKPVRTYKLYLKNFNRYKRAKRMVNYENLGADMNIHRKPDQKNSSSALDYSFLSNLISTRPSIVPRTTEEKSSTTKIHTNSAEDNVLNMMPRKKYEDIITNEIRKAKRKMMEKEHNKDNMDTLNKNINNEVDLIEYLELQKSLKSKMNRNKTEDTEKYMQVNNDAPLNKEKNKYLEKYKKIFNKVIENGNALPQAAGVKNINNQIELFNEPLSEEEIKGIQIKEEAEQRMIFDDDFQKALVHNGPLEIADQSDQLEEPNIISTIIINPVNKFLSSFKSNVGSLLNKNSLNDIKVLDDLKNTSSKYSFAKLADNITVFSQDTQNAQLNFQNNNEDSVKSIGNATVLDNNDNILNTTTISSTLSRDSKESENIQSETPKDKTRPKQMYAVVGPMGRVLGALKNIFESIENVFS